MIFYIFFVDFILATQFFYTITFVGTLLSAIGSSIFVLCSTPREKHFLRLTFALGVTLIISGTFNICFIDIKIYFYIFVSFLGICAAVAVLIFALFANRPGWMPGHENNYFGWTFGVAIASFIALLTSGAFYLLETNIQVKKRNSLKESQTVFNMETNA